jgi:outer membrane protein OmpA-like peptidoglycan-associated protein
MKIRNPHLCILGCLFGALFQTPASSFTFEGLPGTPLTPSATPLGHLGLMVGLSALGHSDESMVLSDRFLHTLDGVTDTADIKDLESGTLRLNVAMGLGRHLDLGLSIPFHADFIGDTKAEDLSGMGPGDPSLTAKLGLPLVGDYVWGAALLGSATLPSKSPAGFLPKHTGYLEGHDSATGIVAPPRYFSTFGFGGSVMALTTVDLTRLELPVPLRASAGVGIKNPGLGGNRLLAGGSLEWVPLPFLQFHGDLQTESKIDDPGLGKDWMVASGGFTATSDDGIFFSLSVQKALSERPFEEFQKTSDAGVFEYKARSLPDLSLGIVIGWSGSFLSLDSDGDGIPDKQDPCPHEKEDFDGYQDFDGCPDDDNDQDSVPDVHDKCPNDPEDRDGFQDEDGCPDPDNDMDGIPDGRDKCPNEAEDKDGFEDFDGCPDLDNDKDGILDPQDKCPVQAEDKDGFEDTDGCPDPDNDKDGIPDERDKCPNEPENFNGFEDGDGCPDVARQQGLPLEKRFTLKGVQFHSGTSELLTGSYAALDSLVETMKINPGTMIEIRGYMDNKGSELEQFRLSEARAMAVRNYLLSRGLAPAAVLARGMGSREPIASNNTAAGRAQNRRIEVYRLN